MDNTTPSSIISAADVTAIGDELKSNIATIAPALLGVMAVTIVVGVVLKLVRKFANH